MKRKQNELSQDKLNSKTGSYWQSFLTRVQQAVSFMHNAYRAWTESPQLRLKHAIASNSPFWIKWAIAAGADPCVQDDEGNNSLHTAISTGNFEAVTTLIDLYPPVKYKNKKPYCMRDNQGNSLLHLAAITGNKTIISLLLPAYEYIYENNQGFSPGILLVKGGHVDAFEVYFKNNSFLWWDKTFSLRNPLFGTLKLLHHASTTQHVAMINKLIDLGADIEAKDELGRTPLHMAALSGIPQACKALLEKGAKIDSKTKNGDLPIHLAADNDKLAACEVLLTRHADIEAKDKDGNTLLHRASQKGQVDVIHLLMKQNANIHAKNGDGLNALHLVACTNHIEACQVLLSYGALIESRREAKSDVTPLFRAVSYNRLEMVKFLVSQRANVNARLSDGRTPMHYLYQGEEVAEIIKILIDNGADINALDDEITDVVYKDSYPAHYAANNGTPIVIHKPESPLERAVSVNAYTVVETLLGYGAQINHMHSLFETAIESGIVEMVRILLKHGAKIAPQSEDKYESTPMQLACGDWNTNPEIVQLLIDNGGDVNEMDVNNSSPLFHAATQKDAKIIDVLLKYGADPNVVNKFGESPFDRTYERRNFEGGLALLVHGIKDKVDKTSNAKLMFPHAAIYWDNTAAFNALLEQKADFNGLTPTGYSPLGLAINLDNLEKVNKLAANGADLNIKSAFKPDLKERDLRKTCSASEFFQSHIDDRYNFSQLSRFNLYPLEIAVKYGKKDIIMSLLSRQVDVSNLENCRELASQSNSQELIDLINNAERTVENAYIQLYRTVVLGQAKDTSQHSLSSLPKELLKCIFKMLIPAHKKAKLNQLNDNERSTKIESVFKNAENKFLVLLEEHREKSKPISSIQRIDPAAESTLSDANAVEKRKFAP